MYMNIINNNVYANVSIDDPYISLYISNVTFGDISAGGLAYATSNVEFDIATIFDFIPNYVPMWIRTARKGLAVIHH